MWTPLCMVHISSTDFITHACKQDLCISKGTCPRDQRLATWHAFYSRWGSHGGFPGRPPLLRWCCRLPWPNLNQPFNFTTIWHRQKLVLQPDVHHFAKLKLGTTSRAMTTPWRIALDTTTQRPTERSQRHSAIYSDRLMCICVMRLWRV